MAIKKDTYRFNPKTYYTQVHPVRAVGEWAIMDLEVPPEDRDISYNPVVRVFLKNNKVNLIRKGGLFYKIYRTSGEDAKGYRKILGSATGKWTLNTFLDKWYQPLIYLESIPDIDVLRYIPISTLNKLGYNLGEPQKGVPFLIGGWR